jgi:D-lactate dehydrogenase (cytochrome)
MTDIRFIEHRTVSEDDRFLRDESKMGGGHAEKIFFPKNEEEISSILKFCSENNLKVTVSGGSTGITGAAVPFGGIVISMEKLNKIIGLGFENDRFFLKVGAAVTLSEIASVLRTKDTAKFEELDKNALKSFENSDTLWLYPVDPTEMSAQIGGTAATNASGAATYRFGPTRNWIKSLTVVLPDGSIHKIERGKCFADASGMFDFAGKKFSRPAYEMPDCKNAAGLYSKQNMDIIDLFIGSEGILGVITTLEIYLEKQNPSLSVVQFFKSVDESLDFVKKLKQSTLKPDFIEFIGKSGLDLIRTRMQSDCVSLDIPQLDKSFAAAVFFDIAFDRNKLAEIAKKAAELTNGNENSWCAWENCEIERIKAFRHAVPESVNATIAEIKKNYPNIHKLGTDFAVADDKFDELAAFYRETLETCGIKHAVFGHIGNNHLHINMLPQNYGELEKAKEIYALMAQKVLELKGTVSAEHGIGKLKHKYLSMMFGEHGINEMKRIKKVFDPDLILNIGNMFEI